MLNQSHQIKQTQLLKPLTTAHLAQTMSLLILGNQELKQTIESELSSNPALEVVESSKCKTCGRYTSANKQCPICSTNLEVSIDSPIVFISPKNDFYSFRKNNQGNESLFPEEFTAAKEDLPTFVLRQIAPDLNRDELPIATHILTSLDEDGFLTINPIEISQYHHVNLVKVNKVLEKIQKSEPIGVGSVGPKDALLAQLEVLSESQHIPPGAKKAINEGMDLLSRHSYYELAKLLGISIEQAKDLAQYISDNLNPFPGRMYWGNVRSGKQQTPTYQSPDIILSYTRENDQKIIVEIISPYSGLLKINSLYREALRTASPDKADKWRSDFNKANLLIKCLKQRNNTLIRLARMIIDIQRNFIQNGDKHLVPITRASIAKKLDVHESTVSRAVAGKMVQLPNKRIIPLSRLFDRSLHIRAELRNIIEGEKQPLSDQKISELLTERGYNIARRTVAKYRSIEGIMPARLRKFANETT